MTYISIRNIKIIIKLSLTLSLLSFSPTTIAGDTLQISQILTRIRQLQVKTPGDFPVGLFPSYRQYHPTHKTKNDDNVFFTGLIVLTLRNLRPYLSQANQALCDTIFAEASPIYHLYQNKNGRNTYNFWRTNPPVIFPNSGWLNIFNKSNALPDDIDDTAIILLALDAPDSTVNQVHTLMQQHVNAGKKKKKNMHRDYRNIPAYSTWFGKHMPVDIDICVLSNALYLFQRHHIPFAGADSATLKFICTAIDNGHYANRSSYVSPHYASTPVILYHLARLMQAGSLPDLEKRKPALIQEARKQYTTTVNPMDKILLSTALLQWQQPLSNEPWESHSSNFPYFEQNDFSYFIANMASMLRDPFRQWMSATGLGRFYYYCPAYNDTLLLEYLVLKQIGLPLSE